MLEHMTDEQRFKTTDKINKEVSFCRIFLEMFHIKIIVLFYSMIRTKKIRIKKETSTTKSEVVRLWSHA